MVPILQERGSFRAGYTGSTLRDQLGLAIPERGSAEQPRRHLAGSRAAS